MRNELAQEAILVIGAVVIGLVVILSSFAFINFMTSAPLWR